MGSQDRIDPSKNRWLLEEPSTPSTRTNSASSSASATASAGKTAQSGQVQRLALALGRDPEELAASIPEDTLRRTKFPVIRIENEDGTISFKEPSGIIEGQKALLAVDGGEDGRVEAPQLRDSSGKFTK